MNAVALMTNVRSRGLRAETEMIEAISDFVFLTLIFSYPNLYDVSTDGKGSASILGRLQRAGIQFVCELVMDFSVTLYLAVIQNYHLMTNSLVKCRRYSVVVAAILSFLSLF